MKRARWFAYLAAVLLAVVAVKTLSMMWLERRAAGELHDGRPSRAAATYSGLFTVNVVDRWVAPNGRGVARFAAGDLSGAAADFRAALALADRCDVRVNLVVTLEAIGDALAARSGPIAGAESYRQATAVAESGTCQQGASSTGDPARRLREAIARLAAKLGAAPAPTTTTSTLPGSPVARGKPPDMAKDNVDAKNERGERRRRDTGETVPRGSTVAAPW